MKRFYILLFFLSFFLFSANGQQIGKWHFTSQGLPMYQYQGKLLFRDFIPVYYSSEGMGAYKFQ